MAGKLENEKGENKIREMLHSSGGVSGEKRTFFFKSIVRCGFTSQHGAAILNG